MSLLVKVSMIENCLYDEEEHNNSSGLFCNMELSVDTCLDFVLHLIHLIHQIHLILVKITFLCTIVVHTLTDNAVHCNSGGRGLCEILMLRNMKWLRKKSEIATLVSFAANAR